MWRSKCAAGFAVVVVISLVFSTASAFPDAAAVEDAMNSIASAVDGALNASIGRSLSSPSEYFGDSYIDNAKDQCLSSGASDSFISCAKFRALRFIHRFASPSADSAASKIVLSEAVHLVRVPEDSDEKIFPATATDDDPRAEASELDRLSRFGLRELERFARSHAMALRVGEGQGAAPRLIDEDAPERDILEETRGRKKKLALLIPLLMLVKFIKLKALLIPILIGVLIIKKILILFAVFLPSILGFLKFCKPPPHHGYEYSSNPSVEYGSTAYGGASYGKENQYSRRNSGSWDPQTAAYRGYQQS